MSNVFLLTFRIDICLPSIGEDAIYQPSALRGQNESLLEVVILYRTASFPTHHTCLQERSPGVRQHILKPSLINLSHRCKGYQKPRARTVVYMKQERIRLLPCRLALCEPCMALHLDWLYCWPHWRRNRSHLWVSLCVVSQRLLQTGDLREMVRANVLFSKTQTCISLWIYTLVEIRFFYV